MNNYGIISNFFKMMEHIHSSFVISKGFHPQFPSPCI